MSILDELILKIDSSIDLYGKLKTFDERWGMQTRAILESIIREDLAPTAENVIYWGSLFADPRNLSPAELFLGILTKTNAVGTGSDAPGYQASLRLIEAYKQGQKNTAKPPLNHTKPDVRSDGGITVKSDPFRVLINPGGGSDSPVPPARKLAEPDLYQPGTTKTRVVPPISAAKQLAKHRWGELICYAVEETGVTSYIPPTAFESGHEPDDKAANALIAFLAIEALPLPDKEKEMLKEALPYWAASGFIAPEVIQGLGGHVKLYAGSQFILNMAAAFSLRSRNASVGTEPCLYLNHSLEAIEGTVPPSRKYDDVPFFAGGRSPGGKSEIDTEGLGYFLGYPWEQRSKAPSKISNLQILFYGKQSPPYGSGRAGSPRLYPAEFNIPEPKAASWAQIKAACVPYMAGSIQCSVTLENTRKLVVWAADKEEGKAVLNRMLTLCSVPKSGGFTFVEADDFGRQQILMYPGHAFLDASSLDENPGKAKFLLYVDSEDKAQFKIYDVAPTN